MTYSQIVILAFVSAVALDLFIVKSSLLRRKAFWATYAIILPFQLLTNWWLTSREIVTYSADAISGLRLAAAPIEDLVYGFALILSVLSLWVYHGKAQRTKAR